MKVNYSWLESNQRSCMKVNYSWLAVVSILLSGAFTPGRTVSNEDGFSQGTSKAFIYFQF